MNGFTDIHCHILPGVDDGPGSLQQALQVLAQEEQNHVSKVILTPHHREGMFETDLTVIRQQFQQLKETAAGIGMKIELYPGCEYHASQNMIRDITAEPGYRLNGSRYVLTEFSSRHRYDFIRDIIYQQVSQGFQPIIAHIERIACIRQEPEHIDELIRLGAEIQITAGAVTGRQGLGMKCFCGRMLKKGQVRYIASDAHNTGSRPVDLLACAEFIEKKYSAALTEELFIKNPERILQEGNNQR